MAKPLATLGEVEVQILRLVWQNRTMYRTAGQ